MLHPHPNPTLHAVHLPELITAIGHQLSLKDLLSCVKVCRDWNQALTPLLWHTVDDEAGSWNEILRLYDDDTANNGRDEAWIYAMFAKYGQHIRRLKARWGIIIIAASTGGTCQNLRSLDCGPLYYYETQKQRAIKAGREPGSLLGPYPYGSGSSSSVFGPSSSGFASVFVSSSSGFGPSQSASGPSPSVFGSPQSAFGAPHSVFGSSLSASGPSQSAFGPPPPAFGPSSSGFGSSQSAFVPNQQSSIDSSERASAWTQSSIMTESESAEAQYALVSPILEGVFKPPQQSLFGSKSSVKAEHEWAAQQHLWLLIRQNHSLRSLILDQLTNQIATFANFDFYYDTLSALKDLTELKSHLYGVSPLRLLDHIPSLQRLSTFKSLDIYLGALNKRTWTNIRALECVAAFRHQGLLHALRCLPNLEDLKATWVYERTPGPFSSDGTYDISRPEIWVNVEAILGTTPTRLRRLSLSLTENTQKALPLLIPLCPDLVEITIPKLDHSIATALASYCPSLQIFRIGNALSTGFEGMGTPRPVINVANILFSNCRHLRVFDGIHHAIKIDLLQDQPWVCPNLEVLRCQFVGFERLNNFEQQLFESALRSSESVKGDLTRVYKKYEQSKCQHELFFSTLAQLWNLRFLDIGQHHLEITRNTFNLMYPCNPEAQYVHVVPDSPSLTLFYGLDQLASLTKLENFSFEGINHRMEEQDITWIATHWSKLKWILGLDVAFTLPGYELSSKYMRNVLQKTIQRLRPDIERQPSRVVVEHGPF